MAIKKTKRSLGDEITFKAKNVRGRFVPGWNCLFVETSSDTSWKWKEAVSIMPDEIDQWIEVLQAAKEPTHET